jgi:hypothetical protein
MQMRLMLPFIAATFALGIACGGNPPPDATMGGDPNVITHEQIAPLNVANAGDAIRRLRPNWLRSRAGVDEEPVVYVDAARRGGIRVLSTISTELIEDVRYLSGPDATTRLGTGHRGGAILISTRR